MLLGKEYRHKMPLWLLFSFHTFNHFRQQFHHVWASVMTTQMTNWNVMFKMASLIPVLYYRSSIHVPMVRNVIRHGSMSPLLHRYFLIVCLVIQDYCIVQSVNGFLYSLQIPYLLFLVLSKLQEFFRYDCQWKKVSF